MTKKAILGQGAWYLVYGAGERTYIATTFTFDDANRLVSSTVDGVTTRYTYDAAGRLVKEGNKTYRYGYLDKVMSVSDGRQNLTYDYHADGQIASADYGNGKTEEFLWDGLALVHRGGEHFINEPHVGGGNPVVSSKGVSYFNDMLGTTLGKKEKSGKYSVAAITAFGENLSNHSPTPTQNSNFFTGKPFVEGLGHAFLMRNYRASLGKWQTADPLGYPDGWNPLAYCGNWGTQSVDFGGACQTCPRCGPNCPCLTPHYYYPEWFHNNNANNLYCLGRDGFPILNPGHPIARAIEDYFPSGHYFAVVHDSWVDALNLSGVFEWVTNIGSMPFAYIYSFGVNAYDSFLDLIKFGQDTLGLNIVDIDNLRVDPIILYQCSCLE